MSVVSTGPVSAVVNALTYDFIDEGTIKHPPRADAQFRPHDDQVLTTAQFLDLITVAREKLHQHAFHDVALLQTCQPVDWFCAAKPKQSRGVKPIQRGTLGL